MYMHIHIQTGRRERESTRERGRELKRERKRENNSMFFQTLILRVGSKFQISFPKHSTSFFLYMDSDLYFLEFFLDYSFKCSLYYF
jgi:hypothetical protein